MRASFCRVLLVLPLTALLVANCGPHVRVKSVTTVQVHAVIADLTLELFWNLASLQVRDSAGTLRLLNTNPREPLATLRPLEVGFEEYQQQLAAAAGVRPVVLFLPHGGNFTEEARRLGLAISPWPVEAPPALFSGPKVDTLILFETLDATDVKATLSRIALAQSPAPDPIRLYRVSPGEWKASVSFEHVRCGRPGPDVQLVTKLTYRGGSTDLVTTTPKNDDWKPCALSSDPDLRSATVKQRSRDQADQPVVVASSQFLDPHPSILLSEWIRVR
ncbi:MAG TPA: hypothetical protein VFR31_13710 [Thermoanaerobaculia bacterium]|nr:hypothetical protein [Thermoanaerobaculia bacterium]